MIFAEEVELGDVRGGATVQPVPERREAQVRGRSVIPATCAVVVVYRSPILAVRGSEPGDILQAGQRAVD